MLDKFHGIEEFEWYIDIPELSPKRRNKFQSEYELRNVKVRDIHKGASYKKQEESANSDTR